MNNLNSLILEGRLPCEPVFTELPTGVERCNFKLDVSRFYKDDDGNSVEEISTFDNECYGEYIINACKRNLHIGKCARVVGRLRQMKYVNPDGKNCSKTVIVVEHIDFKA